MSHSDPNTKTGSTSCGLDATVARMVFHDGYSPPLQFYNEVKSLVEEVIHCLHPDGAYTAEQLCGEEYWATLGSGKQKMAGRCLAYMVAQKLLPLRPAQGIHEYSCRYRLKSELDVQTPIA